MNFPRRLSVLAVWSTALASPLATSSCSCGGPIDCPDILPTAPRVTAADGSVLVVDLDRDGSDVVVVVHVNDAAGAAIADAVPVVRVGDEDASVVTEGDVYRAVIAGKHGEVAIDVDVDVGDTHLHVRRTALVLPVVHERWGQPFLAEGLVNTCGWEDGAAQSPDGAWLFTQTLPVAINCILGNDCRVRGEVDAPKRPDMPGRDRIHDDDDGYDVTCPSLGYNFLPPGVKVPPNAFYGFRRQDDGSYGEPFPLEVANSDGCFGVFGFTPYALRDDDGVTKAQSIWAFDTSGDVDVYAQEVTLGQGPVALGSASVDDGGNLAIDMEGSLNLPAYGGNPTVVRDGAGKIVAVAFDDESLPEDDQDLFAQRIDGVLGDDAEAKGERKALPIADAGVQDKMPFFGADADGQQFILWNRDTAIASARFDGGDVLDDASYGAIDIELDADGGTDVGDIFSLGEPTTSVIDGKRRLSFIYVVVRADGTFDLNLALVDER